MTHTDSITVLFIEEEQDVVLRLGDWLNTLAESSVLPIFIWKLCASPMSYDQFSPSGVSVDPPTIRGESPDCWPLKENVEMSPSKPTITGEFDHDLSERIGFNCFSRCIPASSVVRTVIVGGESPSGGPPLIQVVVYAAGIIFIKGPMG